MTRKELSDNLAFLSALKMLEGLAAAGKLTNEEKEKAREELERRLRPTLLFAWYFPLFLMVLLPRFLARFSLVLVNGYCGETMVLCVAERRSKKIWQQQTQAPQTAHTTNPVPFILVTKDMQDVKLKDTGALCDIAPTVLDLLGIKKPKEMTGESLIEH